MNLLISVIVCTHNRAQGLRRTLESFESMSVASPTRWELIVVNNNSTDETKSVVNEFGAKGTLPVRYVFEPKQGLSFARNAGVSAASGNILAFTDDDCIVCPDWLDAIGREFELDTSLAGLGGRVELFNPHDAPVTIRPIKERILFVSVSQLFNMIVGCNMAFKRAVFEQIGGFDPNFGSGTRLVVDDVDFVYRAFKAGLKLVVTPEPLVYHNHGRRTEIQLRSLKKSYLMGRGGFYCKHILTGDREILRIAYWEINALWKKTWRQFFSRNIAPRDISSLWNLLLGTIYRLKEELRLCARRQKSDG